MIAVTVDDSAIRSTLAALQARTANLQPAMRTIGADMVERIRMGFKQSQSPYGDKWTALSATTQALNKARRAGGQPLLDTGKLRASISFTATGTGVTVGSELVYAGTHQNGAAQGQYGRSKKRHGPIPWGRVPARPFMPIRNGRADLPDEWSEGVVDIIRSHIMKAAMP
jgi:phage virion morphogenesis protein